MKDSDKYIEQLKKRLSDLDPHMVLLFGSHASGTSDEDSDIDLMVVTKDEFARDFRTKGKIIYEGTSRTMA